MPFTREDIQNLIRQAGSVVNETIRTSGDLGQTAKDELYQNSAFIQSQIDKFLANNGVLTDKELNDLDEAVRRQKIRILFLKSQQTNKKLLLMGGSIVLVILGVWYITTIKK